MAPPPKILVVEDDPAARRLVVRSLQRMGYVTEEEEDGDEAFRALNGSTDYRLLISDIGLPGMNGVDLVVELRKTAHRRNLPIIVISASTPDDIQSQSLNAAGAVFFEKPVDFSGLNTLVRSLVE